MSLGSFFRGFGRRLGAFFNWLGDRFSYNERGTGWRLTKRVLQALVLFVPIYFVAGMWWIHKVDDNPTFTVSDESAQGGSQAVAMAASLIEREIRDNGWVPNDTMLSPGYFCDNMENYQLGMIGALSRFATELRDLFSRTRGSGQEDPDLQAALELNYAPDVWIWKGWTPQASSETVFLRAAKSLRKYNARVATGSAVFERRADNLASALERMASDLGASSAALFVRSGEGWSPFDWTSDNLFYRTKGQAYVYYMLLKSLRDDFQNVIAEKELVKPFNEMLKSFEAAVRLAPWAVSNGSPDSMVMPNHLTGQGFYLLRARTQLREIVDILRA